MVATPAEAGLCATCHHVRKLESERGSVFYLCRLAADDPRLEKYPHLPMRVCHGYQQVENSPP